MFLMISLVGMVKIPGGRVKVLGVWLMFLKSSHMRKYMKIQIVQKLHRDSLQITTTYVL